MSSIGSSVHIALKYIIGSFSNYHLLSDSAILEVGESLPRPIKPFGSRFVFVRFRGPNNLLQFWHIVQSLPTV